MGACGVALAFGGGACVVPGLAFVALGIAYAGAAVFAGATGGFTSGTGALLGVLEEGVGGGGAEEGIEVGGIGDWIGGGCGMSIGKEEVTKFMPFIPEFILMSPMSIGPIPALPISMVLMVMFGSEFEVVVGGEIYSQENRKKKEN